MPNLPPAESWSRPGDQDEHKALCSSSFSTSKTKRKIEKARETAIPLHSKSARESERQRERERGTGTPEHGNACQRERERERGGCAPAAGRVLVAARRGLVLIALQHQLLVPPGLPCKTSVGSEFPQFGQVPLLTETKVESGTSESKSGTSVDFR
jgi:hypothetical protein